MLIKGKFESSSSEQKRKLADQFVTAAGRDGINNLAATPDGQHALAVVYDHADDDSRQFMRQVHEEQGNTAVDYTNDTVKDGPKTHQSPSSEIVTNVETLSLKKFA